MLTIFDVYSTASQDLFQSLQGAGFTHPTVVLEPHGFLPDLVESPFLYFLGESGGQKRGRYFNEVPVPDFWEIIGDNQGARIKDYNREVARICYYRPSHQRIVERVEWLDQKGQVVTIDRYDQYGRCYAQTTCDGAGAALLTTYYDGDQIERVTENHVTGDILLSLAGQPLQFFKNRLEFYLYYLGVREFDLDRIFFNTLATSFSLSIQLSNQGRAGEDVLFWQEPLGDSLPGNMQLILTNDQIRSQKIIIPHQATYERALQLAPAEKASKFSPLGYLYDIQPREDIRKDAFVLTNSDQIESLETLAQALPNVRIRVAALTEMSPKLMSMMRYPNIVLYQNISQQKIKDLLAQSSIYLDINHYAEVQGIVRKAFEQGQVILGYEHTVHDRRFLAPENCLAKGNESGLVERIQAIYQSEAAFREALASQVRQSDALTAEAFAEGLKTVLGEDHDRTE
ncbi:accessory Sec system glycosylation chaperone GtfB [Streptococcus sp. DD13]|uniref:accessory Sec system glycosylation chaperone GtfB n=1 Tax=Streptococcus sp. DD13 TaxID=1777881 RepID=UPI0007961EB0|nr:accessory Sec system glycosylation chaperone GtfB [Streptococcus sp. DD13]KXT77740.1 GftB: Glycosyl transferase, family 8 [Streptococcus sp. DD13]